MRYRIVSGLLACLLVLGCCTACGNKATSDSKQSEGTEKNEEIKTSYTINDGVRAYLSNSKTMFTLQDESYVKIYDKSELTEDGTVIEIDTNDTRQEILGFGGSFTDTSAYLLMEMPEEERNKAMMYLFDDEQGIGLDFIRNCIGSSDFALEYYTYDDMPEGQEDWELANFDFSEPLKKIIPLTKQAMEINPDVKVILSPWTAPLWMKTDYEWKGSSGVQLRRECYDVYAKYLAKSIKSYEEAGVPVWAMTPQNEMYGWVPWPGMIWTWEGMAGFINDKLRPALDSQGLSTKILALDHNFNYHEDADSIMASTMLSADGVAYHAYDGVPEEMLSTYETFKDATILVTESASSAKGTGLKVTEITSEIARSLRSGSQGYLLWNFALGQNGGPTYNDVNLQNTAFVICNTETNEVSFDVDYYTVAHFSKFIHQGATVVNSTDTGADTEYGLVNVVTVNPNGSMTAVLVNSDKKESKTCKFVLGDKVMEVTLEPRNVVTLTWDGNVQE